MCAVSDLALIILAAPDSDFAQDGINPHLISERVKAAGSVPSGAGGQPGLAGSERCCIGATSHHCCIGATSHHPTERCRSIPEGFPSAARACSDRILERLWQIVSAKISLRELGFANLQQSIACGEQPHNWDFVFFLLHHHVCAHVQNCFG